MRRAIPGSGDGEWGDVELGAALESLQRNERKVGKGGQCGKG